MKLEYYVKTLKIKHIVGGGGVFCNSLLRKEITRLPYKVLLPSKTFCNDNAAMIGIAALHLINER
jgi:tRNA A37 threonylcarbamoyltransferase TsaD